MVGKGGNAYQNVFKSHLFQKCLIQTFPQQVHFSYVFQKHTGKGDVAFNEQIFKSET